MVVRLLNLFFFGGILLFAKDLAAATIVSVHLVDGYYDDKTVDVRIVGEPGKRRAYADISWARIKPQLELTQAQIEKLIAWADYKNHPPSVSFEKVKTGTVNGTITRIHLTLEPIPGNEIELDHFSRAVRAFYVLGKARHRNLKYWWAQKNEEWFLWDRVKEFYQPNWGSEYAISFAEHHLLPVHLIQKRAKRFVRTDSREHFYEIWGKVVTHDDADAVLRGATDRLTVYDIPHDALLHLRSDDLPRLQALRVGDSGAELMGLDDYRLPNILKFKYPPRSLAELYELVARWTRDEVVKYAGLSSTLIDLRRLGKLDDGSDVTGWARERMERKVSAPRPKVSDHTLPLDHSLRSATIRLRSRSAEVRRSAFRDLVASPLDVATQMALVHTLLAGGKAEREIQKDVVQLLTNSNLKLDLETEQTLVYFLRSARSSVRNAAFAILSVRSLDNPNSWQAVVDLVGEKGHEGHNEALKLIENDAVSNPVVATRLMRLMIHGTSPEMRAKITALFSPALWEKRKREGDWTALNFLIADVLSTKNHTLTVRAAVFAAASIKVTPIVQSYLVDRLADPRRLTREAAVHALRFQRSVRNLSHGVLPMLARALENPRSRDYAALMLADWFDFESPRGETLSVLLTLVNSTDETVRRRANDLLSNAKNRSAIPVPPPDPITEPIRRACGGPPPAE